MTPPVATYRLQFRNGVTFERAAKLADYLARLGVSHLYASPLFAAAPGSTHGYDGIDFTLMEPAIGGEEGFSELCVALEQAGLGLLLDFVPNHMAAADDNRWWRAILEWGAASPFAATFDIDWSAPKLILPILGAPYGEALRDGVFRIAFDAAAGEFSFTCYDRCLPLTPPSYERLLTPIDDPALAEVARGLAAATVDTADALKHRLADLAAEPARAARIADAATAASSDLGCLHEIHEQQVWRLTYWRLAREALTYRRFFEIAELICLRVEDPAVFHAVHARLFELITRGVVAGVRLDHIDGLADPKSYLERFLDSAGAGEAFYVLVEKILERDERLPPDWPVAGTTGYEFIAALSDLFVDRRREAAMSRAYATFTGVRDDFAAAVRAAKRQILAQNFAAELARLTDRATVIAARDAGTRDLGTDSLRRAIVELVAVLPVYRSYVNADGPSEADRALIGETVREAKLTRAVENSEAIAFVARLLLLEMDRPDDRKAALAFAIRFQQTSGPVMAKAMEDTMFYRYNRLIALNEVGGAPDRYGAPISAFHAAMAQRQDSQPAGLSTTSTHDTKRGEDARARLYVLSEMPEAWQRAVVRWAKMNAPYRTDLPDGTAPEPAIEWLFYQALIGAWPADLTPDEAAGGNDRKLAALRRRLAAFMEKAVREAKLRSSWTAPNPSYEAAVADFVNAVLAHETGRDFLLDFAETSRPIWCAGAVNTLTQLVVKLAAPGVPDIYQGAELWDFSLVDPDNRTPIDFTLRRCLSESIGRTGPEALLDDWETGAPKMRLTIAGLRARAELPELFLEGSYTGLDVSGSCARHVVAFARSLKESFAVVVAPRFLLDLIVDTERPIVPPKRWGDTAVALPVALRGRAMRNAVTGNMYETGNILRVSDVLTPFPVALLVYAD